MNDEALRYAEQLDAHMDAGGSTNAGNVRALIGFIRTLTAERTAADERLKDFVTFVHLWLTRKDVSFEERKSIILNHPFARALLAELKGGDRG